MPPFFTLWLSLGLSLTARAQTGTISLGNIQQYEGILTSTPVLNGTQIAYADSTTDDGLDVFILPALQSTIQEAQNETCQSSAQQCFEGIQDLIYNPNTEIQSRAVGARQLSLVAHFGAAMAVLFASFLYMKQDPIPTYVHIPEEQIIDMSLLSRSTRFVTVLTLSRKKSSVLNVLGSQEETVFESSQSRLHIIYKNNYALCSYGAKH